MSYSNCSATNMELVCRACLKLNVVRFNIFEYSHNSRLLSDVLMELTSIKVSKDDGFPISICNNCVEKLKSANDFKQMVIVSDRELLQLHQSRTIDDEKELERIRSMLICVKEETVVVKTEPTEISSCVSSNDQNTTEDLLLGNCENIWSKHKNIPAELDLTKSESCLDTNIKVEYTTDLDTSIVKTEPVEISSYVSSNYQNTTEDLLLSQCENIWSKHKNIPAELNLTEVISDSESCSNTNIKIEYTTDLDTSVVKTEPMEISSCVSSNDQNTTEDIWSKHKNIPAELDLTEDMSDSESCSDTDIKVEQISDSDKSVHSENQVAEVNSTVCTNKKGIIKDCNLTEEQLKMDNPDCRRIMESGLTRREKSGKPVLCKVCNRTFSFRYYVQVHIHQHIGNLPFKCEKCNSRFVKKYQLTRHMGTHSQKEKFACDKCDQSFALEHQLKQHKDNELHDSLYNCTLCNKSFKSESYLHKHELYHKTGKKFVCEECGKTFVFANNLEEHKLVHAKEKLHRCNICKKPFKSLKCLRKHKSDCKGPKQFICVECGRSFVHLQNFQAHFKEEAHTCGMCEKTFKCMTYLRKHELHHKIKEITCDQCGKSFSYQRDLNIHKVSHSKEKKLGCKTCGKFFSYKHSLARHMLIHAGIKPHTCQICGNTFRQAGSLSRHMSTHTKETPHSCNLCAASFKHSHLLKSHLKKHGIVIVDEGS